MSAVVYELQRTLIPRLYHWNVHPCPSRFTGNVWLATRYTTAVLST